VINDTGKIGYQNGRALMLKLSYYEEKISEKNFKTFYYARFEVFMSVTMKITDFWESIL
jgi:ribosomal protein S4